jgi:VWFA-related protein
MDFSELYYVRAQPTNDLRVLDEALESLTGARPRGGTALYDVIVAACHLGEAGEPARRVLVVLTDGEDNASRNRLDQAMAVAERTGTQLYFIGTFSQPAHSTYMHRAMKVLRSMANATGGEFIPSSNKREMEPAFNSIAELLRAQYALEFQPVGVSPGKRGNRIQIRCSRPGVKVVAPEKY